MDYQEVGTPKPGAAVLAEVKVGTRNMPLLVTENYGRGRMAMMATESHMALAACACRWTTNRRSSSGNNSCAGSSPIRRGACYSSIPSPMLFDDGHVRISADVRDKNYMPARRRSRGGAYPRPAEYCRAGGDDPDPNSPGVFNAEWTAEKPGTYTAEMSAKRGDEDVGRDTLMFQRMDGVAENFHTEQDRDLLEKLSSQTGGQYWQPQELSKLGDQIPYSEAGITIRQAKELWNMPVVFLLILLLPAAEWILRRRWGVV